MDFAFGIAVGLLLDWVIICAVRLWEQRAC